MYIKNSLYRIILSIIGLMSFALPLSAAGSEGVSPYAYKLGEFLNGIPITNAMVTSWVISLLLILGVRFMVGKPTLIPSRGQAVVENLVTGIYNIVAPIVGKHAIKASFPLLIGLFTFILIHNWSGMIPGVGAFGLEDANGHLIYWFRPANADMNMTLALAIVHFIAWLYIIIRYAGPKIIAYDLFGNKADKKEVPVPIYYFLFIIFAGVGLIEVISIIFRLISLSFRLYGNVFGGENLITSMTGLAGWVVPVPFYFLEILIGLVQALVFTLLVSVYIGLICNHDSEEHAH